MKTVSKMPTTIAVLSLSWIIVFIGLSSGLYLIFNALSVTSLIIGILVLLAGLLLGAVTRILANIGQMAFEMQNFVITSFLNFSRQQDNIATVIKYMDDNTQFSINNLNKSLSNSLHSLDDKLKGIDDNLALHFRNLNDSVQSNMNNLNESLINNLQNVDAKLRGIDDNLALHFRNLNDSVQSNIKDFNENITSSLQNINAQLKSMYDELYNLKDSCIQTNCDSRDINQNIYAIKDFFEKIEKRLDLKK